MRTCLSTPIFAVLAVVFAFTALYLLPYAIGGEKVLGYALVLLFAVGTVVAGRLARDSFAAHRR
jgi:hypothetical protein